MIRNTSGACRRVAHAALLALAAVVLASCGSGAVSGPSTPASSGPITITPSIATLYSDLPTTFVISGGTGSYIVLSSDQSIVPAVAALNGNTLTLVPNEVAADTAVTLTVRDTGTTAPATAALTVKPRTISNTVTITPSSSQAAACGTAICSGGDGEVKVTLEQAGIPLVGRTVRFDVQSGDVQFITSPAGVTETLATTATSTTDGTGTARIRVRVRDNAEPQTALLRITDVASGFTQTASLTVGSSAAALDAQPRTLAFQGVSAGTCANGISADVIVFGGQPPYVISRTGAFSVSPLTLASSGSHFTVGANGVCATASLIAIVDASGATVSVTATNSLAPTTTTGAFGVSPSSVTLDSCAAVANVSLTGGTGTYLASSGNSAIAVSVTGNIGSIQRSSGSPSAPTSATVTFSDGQTTRPVGVTLSGSALGPC